MKYSEGQTSFEKQKGSLISKNKVTDFVYLLIMTDGVALVSQLIANFIRRLTLLGHLLYNIFEFLP